MRFGCFGEAIGYLNKARADHELIEAIKRFWRGAIVNTSVGEHSYLFSTGAATNFPMKIFSDSPKMEPSK
jgi:hypothetical protein